MTVAAYAKINLTLEVIGRRPDGFHALRSVVVPITLADELTFEPTDEFSTDTGYGAGDLIIKAAKALKEAYTLRAGSGGPLPLPAYSVQVKKRIPVGGGLGGGSSDAAATLLALNELWGLGYSPERLAEIGARVGSDVPALVLGTHYRSPVLMEGRGEEVRLLARPAAVSHYVLVAPRIHSSTPAVYAEYDRLAGCSNVLEVRANHLEGPALSLYPEIAEAMAALRAAGADDVMMSGSGSTVFGSVPSAAEADRVVSRMQATGKYDIILADSLS